MYIYIYVYPTNKQTYVEFPACLFDATSSKGRKTVSNLPTAFTLNCSDDQIPIELWPSTILHQAMTTLKPKCYNCKTLYNIKYIYIYIT